MLNHRLDLEFQKPSFIPYSRKKNISQHVLELLFPLKNMIEHGFLLENEQSLLKLLD